MPAAVTPPRDATPPAGAANRPLAVPRLRRRKSRRRGVRRRAGFVWCVSPQTRLLADRPRELEILPDRTRTPDATGGPLSYLAQMGLRTGIGTLANVAGVRWETIFVFGDFGARI